MRRLVHTRRVPYLEAADRVYRRTGMPIMRHLALAYPDDEHVLRVTFAARRATATVKAC